MLVDIISLPSLVGLNSDTRKQLASHMPIDYEYHDNLFWPDWPSENPKMFVGGNIIHPPMQIFKATYVTLGRDNKDTFVTELVFGLYGDTVWYWYARIIENHPSSKMYFVRHGISLATLSLLNNHHAYSKPIIDVLSRNHEFRKEAIDRVTIVPPIFSKQSFYEYLDFIITGIIDDDEYMDLDRHHLKKLDPGILMGLSRGHSRRSPLHEISNRAFVEFPEVPKWTLWEELKYRKNATGCTVLVNDPSMGPIVEIICDLLPIEFSISCSIEHVIESVPDNDSIQNLDVKYYADRYSPIIKHNGHLSARNFASIHFLFRNCLEVYWDTQDDIRMSFKNREYRSSKITITKNRYEEISVIVEDHVSKKHVCFYMSIPVFMMTTWSVGTEF